MKIVQIKEFYRYDFKEMNTFLENIPADDVVSVTTSVISTDIVYTIVYKVVKE